jgi:pyruvate kinase
LIGCGSSDEKEAEIRKLRSVNEALEKRLSALEATSGPKIDQAKVESLKAEIEKMRFKLKADRDEVAENKRELDRTPILSDLHHTIENCIDARNRCIKEEESELSKKEEELQTLLKGS